MNALGSEGAREVRAPVAPPAAGRVPLPLVDGKWRVVLLGKATPFLFAPAREQIVATTLTGARYEQLLPKELPPIRRILDLGAGEGAFACWAWTHFGGRVWIDMIEWDPTLGELAVRNAPPGAVLLPGGDLEIGDYDLIRVGRWPGLKALKHLAAAPVVILDMVLTRDDQARAREEEKAEAMKRWDGIVRENATADTEPAPSDEDAAQEMVGLK